jgi:cation diffusion facilitator family transporter
MKPKPKTESKEIESSHGSIVVVIAAMISNIIIFVSKIIAATITHSSSMLAESIHSVVDIGNSALVYLGIRQSKKPADADHPFGYGSEVYFWSMIVAISIFGIGGGISMFEGFHHIFQPVEIHNAYINYIVIGIGIVVEGTSLVIATRHFNEAKGHKGFFAFIRQSKDPSLFTVVFEDSAAVLGLVIALISVFLSDSLGIAYADGVGSCLIGAILMIVSFFLARESKGLLIGEGVEPYTLNQMRETVMDVEGVEDIGILRTLYLGPDTLLVNLDVKFISSLNATEINAVIDIIEDTLRNRWPVVKHIYIEVASRKDIKRTRYEPAH